MGNWRNFDELCKERRVWANFNELCKIPHPSFHEEAISNWLKEWALQKNFEVLQDNFHNILIRKPASKGYEHIPGVILQAHMDMVPEKALGLKFDFLKDSITPILEGDLITTGGKTTLGADDGIGVALAMTVLEEDTLQHPPLEVLFTTAEEEDFSGALGFDSTIFQGKYLINLDNGIENEIIVGSCGGCGVKVDLPINWNTPYPDTEELLIEVSGLLGGHSGEDIHKGHGNAIEVLGRILYALKDFHIQISELCGGNFRLAIPREAHAKIVIPKDKKTEILSIIEILQNGFEDEFISATPNFHFSVTETTSSQQSLDFESTYKVIHLLSLFPDGIYQMNNTLEGIVESSDNLGELYIENNSVIFVCEIRAEKNSHRKAIENQIKCLTEIFNASMEIFSEYPSWNYVPNSSLQNAAISTYEKVFSEKPHVKVVHAGLECGCLLIKNPTLDAISFGPNSWRFHSPDECVSISSVERVQNYIYELLTHIN